MSVPDVQQRQRGARQLSPTHSFHRPANTERRLLRPAARRLATSPLCASMVDDQDVFFELRLLLFLKIERQIKARRIRP